MSLTFLMPSNAYETCIGRNNQWTAKKIAVSTATIIENVYGLEL